MKTFILLLLSLSICACGVVRTPVKKLEPEEISAIWQAQDLHLVAGGMSECHEAFTKVLNYLHLNGVGIRYEKSADKTLVCLPGDPGFVKVLSVARLEAGALQNGDVAYVKVTGDSDYDAKLMLHELCHIFWGCEHTSNGLMSFSQDVRALSPGFSDATWAHVKERSKPLSTMYAAANPTNMPG